MKRLFLLVIAGAATTFLATAQMQSMRRGNGGGSGAGGDWTAVFDPVTMSLTLEGIDGTIPTNTVISTGTPVTGAIPTYSNTTGTNLAPSSVTISGGTNLAAGTITVTNQSGFTGYTVATLPTGVGVGYQTYCTDCLTPWGTGDRVEWDGAAWRTMRQKVLATTNATTYILSCTAGSTYIATPLSDIAFSAEAHTALWNFPRVTGAGGAAASVTLSTVGTESTGTYMDFTTGSTTTGHARVTSYYIPPMVAGGYYACGGTYHFGNLPDGTETYWAIVGLDSGIGGTYPTTGAFFLYDLYNTQARADPGAETNNWLCVTAKSSAYTYADSGLSPSTTAAGGQRLAIICTTTAAYFYTNGVVAITNTANLPVSANMYTAKALITKTAGGTTRSIRETNPWYHIRRAAARTY